MANKIKYFLLPILSLFTLSCSNHRTAEILQPIELSVCHDYGVSAAQIALLRDEGLAIEDTSSKYLSGNPTLSSNLTAHIPFTTKAVFEDSALLNPLTISVVYEYACLASHHQVPLIHGIRDLSKNALRCQRFIREASMIDDCIIGAYSTLIKDENPS